MIYGCIWVNATGQPYIPSYHRVMAHNGFTTQDGRTSVDDDMVLNNGMTLGIGHVLFHIQGSQGDSLVQLDMFTDPTGFSNHDTRTMVNMQVLINKCSRMDVNARFGMCMFRQ